MSETANYDVVDYPTGPLSQAHPGRLATLARLLGLQPAALESCRVLDIGCGDGTHSLHCAAQLPTSHFVGIDLAGQAVARGRRVAERLGLSNIELHDLDLMEFPTEGPPFDYIVAHGFYSWVPPQVRDRLMAVIRGRLAEGGVAYVSYNTYPGCYIRRMFWEMMKRHVQQLDRARDKIEQAIEFMKFLHMGAPPDPGYAPLIERELRSISPGKPPEVVYHDDLAEVNDPVYFQDFVAHAAEHDLQFLAEADFWEMHDQYFPPAIRKTLDSIEHPVLREQYLDYLRCRRFRQTLLCRREATIEREIGSHRVQEFLLTTTARAVDDPPSLQEGQAVEFCGAGGLTLKLSHAFTKAALVVLAEAYPRALPYGELLARVRGKLQELPGWPPADPKGEEDKLCHALLEMYRGNLLRWQVYQVAWPEQVSEHPRVFPMSRIELESSLPVVTTVNMGVTMEIESDFERETYLLADGSREIPQIIRLMQTRLERREVSQLDDDEGGSVEGRVRQFLAKANQSGLLVE